MKSIKTISLFLFTTALLIVAPAVLADYGETPTCTNQYGNAIECPPNRIVINKKIRAARNAYTFVENITSADAAYSIGDEVEYDIAVTNTSNVNFPTVTVIDIFPAGVTFLSGPGRFEANSNKLTYEISDLNAGATAHSRVLARIKDASFFTNDLTCDVINTATATGPGGQSDQDTASMCVQTKVMGVTTLPVAGFEDYAYMLPFLALAILGFVILGTGELRR